MPENKFKCPACGNTDLSKMSVLEDVPTIYKVIRLEDDDNTVVIESQTNRTDWESSHSLRMLCNSTEIVEGQLFECLQEFPIPEGVEIDWE